jgi:hypothetical protein
MKRMFSVLAVALVVSMPAAAQESQGKYVNSSVARLVKMIDFANAAGYNLQTDQFSAGGVWLRQGKENWVSLVTMELKAGKDYRFLAAGDMDARDVDLKIVNSDGTIVANDSTTNPEAIVNYSPTKTGRYTISIRLYASRESVPSYCTAIVMSK